MKTIQQLVDEGKWESFYLTEKGDKLPLTPENQQIFQMGKVKWSSVSQVKS